MPQLTHKSVLLNEVAEFFCGTSGTIIDATLGLGGHSERILAQNPNAKIIGIDRDKISLEFALARLARFNDKSERFHAIKGDFASVIDRILGENCENCADFGANHENRIAGILADLGISSPQVDNLERGFSFHADNLDMRMDLDSDFNAAALINSYSKDALERVLREFGEVKNAPKIVRLIMEARKKRKITSAKELCQIIESAQKSKGGIHPATLIFQALRIEVNGELAQLRAFLQHIERAKGAKIAIISFHSLEDRMVKEAFKRLNSACVCDESVLKCECGGNHKKGEILTKKPIIPSAAEIADNKRARSAKMRCFRFYE